MLFSRSRPRQKEDLLLIMQNNTIQRTKCIICLRLHIDDKRNWQEHLFQKQIN